MVEECRVVDYNNVKAKQPYPNDKFEEMIIYSPYKNMKNSAVSLPKEESKVDFVNLQRSSENAGNFSDVVFRSNSSTQPRNPSIQDSAITSFKPSFTKVIFDDQKL
jgi:hypothetical protein